VFSSNRRLFAIFVVAALVIIISAEPESAA
jgi:hypothetical protein